MADAPLYLQDADEKLHDFNSVERYQGLEQWDNRYCCPSCLSIAAFVLCPCALCCSCITVKEKSEAVVLSFGEYLGSIQMPGCYFVNCCGTTQTVVSKQWRVQETEMVKVADHNGNPLNIRGLVTWFVKDAKKAVLKVDNYVNFIQLQAQSVLKNVVARYPYEAHEAKSPSLRNAHDQVSAEMRGELQAKADDCGVVVVSFELTDLAYAPEIAGAMLVRQQAEATVSARQTIVKGAVLITQSAIENVEARGIQLSKEEKSQLMSNLLVTICGQSNIQPIIPLQMN